MKNRLKTLKISPLLLAYLHIAKVFPFQQLKNTLKSLLFS